MIKLSHPLMGIFYDVQDSFCLLILSFYLGQSSVGYTIVEENSRRNGCAV